MVRTTADALKQPKKNFSALVNSKQTNNQSIT